MYHIKLLKKKGNKSRVGTQLLSFTYKVMINIKGDKNVKYFLNAEGTIGVHIEFF